MEYLGCLVLGFIQSIFFLKLFLFASYCFQLLQSLGHFVLKIVNFRSVLRRLSLLSEMKCMSTIMTSKGFQGDRQVTKDTRQTEVKLTPPPPTHTHTHHHHHHHRLSQTDKYCTSETLCVSLWKMKLTQTVQ